MIFIILLLCLISCDCGTFVADVSQTSFQAEENQDITLEWTFTTKPDRSLNNLYVYCELLTELKASCVFRLHEGVEVPESQDEQFAGRVQCDKDVLKEGQLRLHVSRLRIKDSGVYVCKVFTDSKINSGKWQLDVTAAQHQPEDLPPKPRQPPRVNLKVPLYYGLVAVLLAAALGVCFCSFRYSAKRKRYLRRVTRGFEQSYSSTD